MGLAGQHNFTGISDQADITLLCLLEASLRDNFHEMIIEGKNWEDFTLAFSDSKKDHEEKSWNKTISYSEVKRIIRKELGKNLSKQDSFVLIAKHINKQFVKDAATWPISLGPTP